MGNQLIAKNACFWLCCVFTSLMFANMTGIISNKTFIEKDITSEDGVKTIRANLKDKEDALAWIHIYSERTNTQWIVSKNSTASGAGLRRVFRKMWMCQHNEKNKSKQNSKRNENCKASIDIKIKKLTIDTLRKDPFLREKPPLQAIIIIKTQHTHPEGLESLRYLRTDDKVRKIFEGYFESGMTTTESRKHHKSLLSLEDNSAELIANCRKNPSERTVRHFYYMWKDKKNGPKIAVYENIKSKIEDYKNQGVDVFVPESIENQPWAILVVTPVMKNTHSLESFSKIIHVVTIAPKRAISCSLTFFIGGASSGPVPLAVLIHETQSIPAYEAAFRLLQENFGYCFGGKNASKFLMTDNISAQKTALHAVWPSSTQFLCRFRLEQCEWTWLNKPKSGVPSGVRRSYLNDFKKIMHANSEESLNMLEYLFFDNVDHEEYKKRMEIMLSETLKEEWILMYRPDSIKGRNFDSFSKATIDVLRDLIPNRSANFSPVAMVETAASKWEQYFEDGLQKIRKTKILVIGREIEQELDEDTSKMDTAEADVEVHLEQEFDIEVQEVHLEQSLPSPSCFVDITDEVTYVTQQNESNTMDIELVWVPADATRISDDIVEDNGEDITNSIEKSTLLNEIGRILDLANKDVLEREGPELLKMLQSIETEEDATEVLSCISSSIKKRKLL